MNKSLLKLYIKEWSQNLKRVMSNEKFKENSKTVEDDPENEELYGIKRNNDNPKDPYFKSKNSGSTPLEKSHASTYIKKLSSIYGNRNKTTANVRNYGNPGTTRIPGGKKV